MIILAIWHLIYIIIFSIDLKNFTGKYNNSFYGDIDIKIEGNKLRIYFSHHPSNIGQLEYMNEYQFLCTYTDLTWEVKVLPFKVEDNKVKSANIKLADFIDPFEYEFEKIN